MKESISFDKNLRNKIRETVKTVAKAVKGTLGPSGTNVGVLSATVLPIIVNDGVTVTKNLKFKDPLKNYILNILKTVSQNTEKLAGDGTTTSITLTEAIILEGLKSIEVNGGQTDIVKGIREATKLVLKGLDENKIVVEGDTLLQVATISANNDQVLGDIISKAFTKVGVDGQIEVTDSSNGETYIEMLPGMSYNSGMESGMFSNTSNSTAEFSDCKVLIYEGKLSSVNPLIEILQETRNENGSLLIIADDYDPMCVEDLVGMKLQSKIRVCAVRSPEYGKAKENALEDIAMATGTKIISRRFGQDIEDVTMEMLGTVTTVKIELDKFNLINDLKGNSDISEKLIALKEESETASGTDKDELLQRIAKLSDSVAVLHVAGDSPIEIAEKKYRIEDAINATRVTMEEGGLPGGGVSLMRVAKGITMPKLENEDQKRGFKILIKALEAPMKTIAYNAGENGDVVLSKVQKKSTFDYGFDAKTKTYGSMVEKGIIDPAKVTKAALTNASSVSQMVLTMNCVIY